ncbi:MAG: ABC transporter ATP-binding protein [Oscillospiraceae bacterium]|nr:ABC transporter ATP-binding protein [Oscillospiraceae bacterium]
MKNNVILRLFDICAEFDDELILNKINLRIYDKSFVTLLGPSGCGKTTTLRIIGGFEKPTSGKLFFNSLDITDLPPYKRKVNTVFQKYALFPHLNVFENIAFGLKIRKFSKKEIERNVAAMLELVNLKGFEKRGIERLSGGQQQRVAIARALVNRPKVLLLDEPLGALDLKLRKEMQTELKNIQQQLEITFVYVTHDQEEALTMSDVVVVMNNGQIQQIGSPIDIYNEPQNAFVADFIGESNIINGIMYKDYMVGFLGHDFICVDKGFACNEEVDVVIRPEDVKLLEAGNGRLEGVVESIIFKGVHYEMKVDSAGYSWTVHSTLPKNVGSLVGIDIDPNDIHIMKKMEI